MIVRAAARAATVTGWLDSRHSFSYGTAYDPANTHFGLLLAHNEDRLAAGAGFDPHPHRDVEVLTWVVSGVLRHTDDAGHAGDARPGVVQRLSAGSGVRHTEHAVGGPAHYVQMWVRPAEFGGAPAYDTVPVGPGLTAVTPLRQPAAVLHAGRLTGTATLPPAACLHLFVAAGTVTVIPAPGNRSEDGVPPTGDRPGDRPAEPAPAPGDGGGDRLGAGDAVRLRDTGAVRLDAPDGAEIVAWLMSAGLTPG